MNKEKFKKLFEQISTSALEKAELKGSTPITKLNVEVHGAGHPGDIMSFDEATNAIYIDQNTFYKVIDVGVKPQPKHQTPVLFVRVSGHKPCSFEETINTPKGNGPFNSLS